jgi:hypothetical protein
MFFTLTSSGWNNFRSCLFGFPFACSLFCSGQVKQESRLEIPIDFDDQNYVTVSAKEDGLILLRKIIGENKDQIEVVRLDTALKETWRGYLTIDQNVGFHSASIHQGSLFVLLRDFKMLRSDFQVVNLDLTSKSYRTFAIKNYISFNPTDFTPITDGVLIAGYFNYRPLIVHYSFTTGKSKILPGLFNEVGELLQIKRNENGTIDVVLSGKNIEHKKCLWIRSYDSEGTPIKTTLLEPDADKGLIFGRSVTVENDQQVVAGVYGRRTEYSRGIFVAHISPNGEYQINYYNFADLQKFFSFMKAKREKRIKDRIERRKVAGKKNRFTYRFLVHELVPYGDQYIMLGEAFYPKYRSQGGFGGGTLVFNRYSGTRSDLIFDGYQYTHAIVIGFSKDGKLLWDNSFEINDVKSFRLEQFVKIQPRDNHISLLYLFDNILRSKIIKDDQVLEGKTTEEIRSDHADDKVQEAGTTPSKLEYWYPGHFYAYGVQRIMNLRTPGVPPMRYVFFINKITDR